jgi:hypothetical protein
MIASQPLTRRSWSAGSLVVDTRTLKFASQESFTQEYSVDQPPVEVSRHSPPVAWTPGDASSARDYPLRIHHYRPVAGDEPQSPLEVNDDDNDGDDDDDDAVRYPQPTRPAPTPPAYGAGVFVVEYFRPMRPLMEQARAADDEDDDGDDEDEHDPPSDTDTESDDSLSDGPHNDDDSDLETPQSVVKDGLRLPSVREHLLAEKVAPLLFVIDHDQAAADPREDASRGAVAEDHAQAEVAPSGEHAAR